MTEARGKVGAIIVAAGEARRMGGREKIFADLGGKPLLARTVQVFQKCASIHEVVLVLAPKDLERGERLVAEEGWTKVRAVCPGGERRQDSVKEGLKRLSGCQWVVIHDGARPCLEADLIERGLEEAYRGGAAVAAVPVKDTIKLVGRDGLVRKTPPRHKLWAVQTPQVFSFDLISRAHAEGAGEVTDDASLVERLGHKVRVYPGSYQNIKVTTPEDLALAEILLKNRERGI